MDTKKTEKDKKVVWGHELTNTQKIIILLAFITKYKTKIRLGDIKITDFDMQWSNEQKEIESKILDGGYIEGYNNDYPKITRDKVCIDGHHRISTLKKIKSDDYMVVVDKVWLLKWSTLHNIVTNIYPPTNSQ